MSNPQSYTKIKIISLALVHIGKGPINSISGAGEFAEAASDVFDLLYPNSIATGSWRFAIKYQELAENVDEPDIDEWDHAWTLPADYLTMKRLSPEINFTIYGHNVYTNSAPSNLYAIYTSQPDIARLPTYFVEFLSYRIASNLAWGMARDKNLAKVFEEKTKEALIMGQAIDAKSHPNVAIRGSVYTDIRGLGGQRGYIGKQ